MQCQLEIALLKYVNTLKIYLLTVVLKGPHNVIAPDHSVYLLFVLLRRKGEKVIVLLETR